jgi:DNA-binding Lrp family transcriptional regulator
MVDGNEIKRKIFGALSASGDLTVSQLATMLRLREHVVRYQLNQLLRSETIHRTVLIDQRALGMLVYSIFFDVPPASQDAVITFFKKRSAVRWFAKFNGPQKFELSIIAANAGEVEKLFLELNEEIGVNLRNRRVALSEDRFEWGMRFLSTEYYRRSPRILRRGGIYSYDELDLKILRELRQDSYLTSNGLARRVGVAASSLAYRLAQLRKANVISDDIYEVRRNNQYAHAVLLVCMKVRSRQSHLKFLEFCQDHPHVKGLIVDVGGWDYRVSLYGDSAEDLLCTADLLPRKLPRFVDSVSVYQRREILKVAAGV